MLQLAVDRLAIEIAFARLDELRRPPLVGAIERARANDRSLPQHARERFRHGPDGDHGRGRRLKREVSVVEREDFVERRVSPTLSITAW